MLFLDANVFLYAVGDDSPWRQPCAQILLAVGTGQLRATTSAEVLQEVLHVCRRRGRAGAGVALVRDALALFDDLLPVGRNEIVLALRLLERQPRLSTRDALHAATLICNGIGTLVTVDDDFSGIAGIEVQSPQQVAAELS